jgi:hypothetical protein
MSSDSSLEKPVGVYLVALYFAPSGFLESIRIWEAAHVVLGALRRYLAVHVVRGSHLVTAT